MQMENNERQRARQHLVAAMLAGQSWQLLAVAYEKDCQEQRELLRAIVDLAQLERDMYETSQPQGSDYDGQ